MELNALLLQSINKYIKCENNQIEDFDQFFMNNLAWMGDPSIIFLICRNVLEKFEMSDLQRLRIATAFSVSRLTLEFQHRKPEHVGTNPILFTVPVWGEEYLESWVKYSLSSILAPENRRVFMERETIFCIFTDKTGRAYLEKQTAIQKLAETTSVLYLDIDTEDSFILPKDRVILRLIAATWTCWKIAKHHGWRAVPFVSDQIYADGSLVNLLNRMDSGEDCICATELPVTLDSLVDLEFFRAGEFLKIPIDKMVNHFRKNYSLKMNEALCQRDGQLVEPATIERLFFDDGDRLTLVSTQPTVMYMSGKALRKIWVPRFCGPDGGVADWVLASFPDARIGFLHDTSQFALLGFFTKLSGEVRLKTPSSRFGMTPDAHVSILKKAALTARKNTPARIKSMQNPIVMSFGANAGRLSPSNHAAVDATAIVESLWRGLKPMADRPYLYHAQAMRNCLSSEAGS